MIKLDSSRSQSTPRHKPPGGAAANRGSISHRGVNTTSGPTANGTTKNTRTLGSMRHSSDSTVTKFPPLPTPRSPSDAMFAGIAGSALSVPPPKPPLEKSALIERLTQNGTANVNGTQSSRDKATESTLRRNSSPRRLIGGGSNTGSAKSSDSSKKMDDALAAKDREIKLLKEQHSKEMKESMTREKELSQQIMQLQKQIDDLKQQVLSKDNLIKQLQQQFQRQEEKYKELYEKECSRHKETQDFLSGVKSDLEKTRNQLQQKTSEFEAQILALNTKMDQSLTELRTEKDKEISVRDEKLTKLKKQMAEALKGNSWERQQQLDELSKELTKVQEECDMLKMKMRSIQKQGGKGGGAAASLCSNCDSLKQQLTAADRLIAAGKVERDKLAGLCGKFETQLTQQDQLLRQFAESKGYKG